MHKVDKAGKGTVCPGDYLYEPIENIRQKLFKKEPQR